MDNLITPYRAGPASANPLQVWRLPRYVLLALVLGTFTTLSMRHLDRPGPYYDELLFVNAATDASTDDFISARIAGLPVMLMPYIGAAKAYIAAPVFWLFGVSTATVRIIPIAFSIASLVIFFAIASAILRPGLAFAATLCLAIDPTFIFATRLDWGPVALMMLCKLAALHGLVVALTFLDGRGLWGVAFFVLLGLYDKLNFIWFVVAALTASCLTFPRQVRSLLIPMRAATALPLAILALGVSWFCCFLILPILDLYATETRPLGENFPHLVELLKLTLNGSAVYSMVAGMNPDHITISPMVFLAALVVGAVLIGARRERGLASPEFATCSRWFGFFVILTGAIAVQIAAARQAIGPHHMMMLVPFPIIIIGLALQVLVTTTRRFGIALSIATFGALALTSARTTFEYHALLSAPAPRNVLWSEAIYDLAARLEESDRPCVLTSSWGLGTQLRALSGPERRDRYRDVWMWFTDFAKGSPVAEQLIDRALSDRPCLVVSFARSAQTDVPGHAGTFLYLDARSSWATRIEVIADQSGKPIYQITTVEPGHLVKSTPADSGS